MGVLADYLADFAKVLGTPHQVHLDRLEEGSVVPVILVEREAVPKVRERVHRLSIGAGPADAVRAYQSINERLRIDNGSGSIVDVDAGGAEIIFFPGRESSDQSYGAIRRQGTLDGELIRVGGRDRNRVRVMLQSEKRSVGNIHAKKSLAKELGNHLYEPVRLFGTGRWRRDPIGIWTLEDFSVDSFERLKSDKLSSAITSLRAIGGGEWTAEAYQEISDLRDEEEDD